MSEPENPPPSEKPKDEEIIPIEALPEWVEKTNRETFLQALSPLHGTDALVSNDPKHQALKKLLVSEIQQSGIDIERYVRGLNKAISLVIAGKPVPVIRRSIEGKSADFINLNKLAPTPIDKIQD
jgi:hypothetical protein